MKNIMNIIIIVVIIGAISIPIIYNFIHPELTRMQIFFKFWWLYILFISVGMFFKYKSNT